MLCCLFRNAENAYWPNADSRMPSAGFSPIYQLFTSLFQHSARKHSESYQMVSCHGVSECLQTLTSRTPNADSRMPCSRFTSFSLPCNSAFTRDTYLLVLTSASGEP